MFNSFFYPKIFDKFHGNLHFLLQYHTAEYIYDWTMVVAQNDNIDKTYLKKSFWHWNTLSQEAYWQRNINLSNINWATPETNEKNEINLHRIFNYNTIYANH